METATIDIRQTITTSFKEILNATSTKSPEILIALTTEIALFSAIMEIAQSIARQIVQLTTPPLVIHSTAKTGPALRNSPQNPFATSFVSTIAAHLIATRPLVPQTTRPESMNSSA
jgi:hypothetical protein